MSDLEEETEEIIEEEQYEMSPEKASSLKGANNLDRKKLLIVICITFSVIIGGGLILNIIGSAKDKKQAEENEALVRGVAGGSNQEFLNSMMSRAAYQRQREASASAAAETAEETAEEPESALPAVVVENVPRPPVTPAPPNQMPTQTPPASPPAPQPPAPQQAQAQPTHFKSSLVPPVQGSLFAQGAPQTQYMQTAAPSPANDYYAQRLAQLQGQQTSPLAAQAAGQVSTNSSQSFFNSANLGGTSGNGHFLGENSIWAGTIIPGILVTAINTDLPGNVTARVTQNVYDSQTGTKLLIPQGSILIAQYNSSVSYAQHRVQLIWDILIRPDGFQLALDGANGVDRAGMAGFPAKYDEHWFEYLKAAGLITLFSIANASMTESAAKYASTEAAGANIAEANSALVNSLGENLVSRAMNIQPTLTVENGSLINIMLNNALYLPPVADFPVTQKYTLRR